MSHDFDNMHSELLKPFPEADIEWRVGRAGKTGDKIWCMTLAYVTNRAIMERLDLVIGMDDWQNEFREIKDGMLCGISIRINSEWVTKWDGAGQTPFEPIKGMISGAEKRAGVPWGIGRYLYKLPSTFAEVSNDKVKGWNRAVYEDYKGVKHNYFWKTPKVPKEFLP
jgi:hypothetical protein